MWLPEELNPEKSFKKYEWDLLMVASIAILAKATPGQGHTIKDILKNIVEARGGTLGINPTGCSPDHRLRLRASRFDSYFGWFFITSVEYY
jgi:hypothetical protein